MHPKGINESSEAAAVTVSPEEDAAIADLLVDLQLIDPNTGALTRQGIACYRELTAGERVVWLTDNLPAVSPETIQLYALHIRQHLQTAMLKKMEPILFRTKIRRCVERLTLGMREDSRDT